jgi:hypothetical protein
MQRATIILNHDFKNIIGALNNSACCTKLGVRELVILSMEQAVILMKRKVSAGFYCGGISKESEIPGQGNVFHIFHRISRLAEDCHHCMVTINNRGS